MNRFFLTTAVLLTLATLANLARSDDALHITIDRLIEADASLKFAPLTSDAEFLRRATLDLAGRTPTREELMSFLADSSADKRTRTIDRLLASGDYPQRMSQAFHNLLMERLGDSDDWQAYLYRSFAANKPWDVMSRELLSPNADDEASRASAFFYVKRLENYGQNPVDIPGLVRDVGRMFLGVDVQCAQCHDHLFVDEYKQEYFQGLLAFVGNLEIRRDVSFAAVAEKPLTKKIEFVSVFVQQPRSVGPQLPGRAEVAIPMFAAGEEFEIAPDRKTKFPGKPKFSTLAILASDLPTAENPYFARNIANRVWWMLMGRGLVHPLDLAHSDNPPSHPELLDALAASLVASKFDLRYLIREITLSRAYQRSSVWPNDLGERPVKPTYQVAFERPLSTQQLLRALLVATDELQRVTADAKPSAADLPPRSEQLIKLQTRLDKSFAPPPREPDGEFAPTVKGSLFLMNDEELLKLLSPQENNLAAQLLAENDPQQFATRLYSSVLSRLPSEEESREVAEWLAGKEPKEQLTRELLWALIASNEFCLNH